MPIYEYICEECDTPYEKLVLSKAEKVTCPKCGSGRMTQQLSTFSAHSGNGAAKNSGGTASGASTAGDFACTGNPSACGCSFKN